MEYIVIIVVYSLMKNCLEAKDMALKRFLKPTKTDFITFSAHHERDRSKSSFQHLRILRPPPRHPQTPPPPGHPERLQALHLGRVAHGGHSHGRLHRHSRRGGVHRRQAGGEGQEGVGLYGGAVLSAHQTR